MEEKREKSIFRLLPLCVCQLEKFALKCLEFAVTNTLSSKDLTTEEKITNLKTLISPKIDRALHVLATGDG